MSTPFGKDLARSQGTDFYGTDDLLTDDERVVRDRVRTFVDDRLVPAAPGYWERAEFPQELVAPYAGLRVAGGAVVGYGCSAPRSRSSGDCPTSPRAPRWARSP
jgi:glutaryl-CoA dehydrogenase